MEKHFKFIMHENKLNLSNVKNEPLKNNEVLIKHTFIGLNFQDYEAINRYDTTKQFTPGVEAVGIIESLGSDVLYYKKGQRVGYCTANNGSFSTHRNISSNLIYPIPEEISDEIAAATMRKGIAAYYLMRHTFFIQKDMYILIHAPSSGVGRFMLSFTNHINARAISVFNHDTYAHANNSAYETVYQEIKNLSAHTIKYNDFALEVKKIAPKGVNVVYDPLGGECTKISSQCLTDLGLLVNYGRISGVSSRISYTDLAKKSAFFTCPNISHYHNTREKLGLSAMEVFGMIQKGIFNTKIGKIYNFDEIPQAIIDIKQRNFKKYSIVKV